MRTEDYGRAILLVCSVGWVMVWLPCILYLTVAWRRGSHGLFPVFGSDDVKFYYRQFLPTEDISKFENGKLKKHFETHFSRLYGRRRFVLPLVLLALVAGVGLWGTSMTLRVWQGLPAGNFTFPPIVVSAFLGAWIWVVNDQFERLRNRDLTFHDVYRCIFRILIAVPFGILLSKLALKEVALPVAFLIGTFPTGTLFTLGRRLAVQQFKLGDDSNQVSNELEKLQSVGRSAAERFMDEGIDTIAKLAWSDPVDLTLRTNNEFDYVIDCASQALVWVYFEDKSKGLYKFSLRTAHEVTSLIYCLDSSDSNKKAEAQVTLQQAATTLGMETLALQQTLRQIEEDPFSRFLVAVWHWPVKEVPSVGPS